MAKGDKLTLTTRLISRQVQNLIDEGRRLDERDNDEFRPIDIEDGVVTKGNGSARVRLGMTDVVAGVNFGLDSPYPDSPESGILVTIGEVLPLASLQSEPGPPTPDEVELSRVVDRGIRESGILSLEEWGIVPGEKVLRVFVDFSVVSHDGNLLDASSMACVAALAASQHPDLDALSEDPDTPLDEITWVDTEINDLPVSVTAADLFGTLVVDPCLEEEQVMRSRLTTTHTADGEICAMQKGGAEGMDKQQIMDVIEMAGEATPEIREKIAEATGREGYA